MKEIAFVGVEKWERAVIEATLPKGMDAEITERGPEELSPAELEKIRVLSTFVYSRIGESLLDRMPRLEAVATRSTGMDHIDLAACKKRGIKVYNVPTYGENTVAEHTFGLILALSRKIYQAVQRAKRGDFSVEGLQGFDLKGKTLGLVGMGHIGQHVARIAKGFEMEVIAFDMKRSPALAKRLGFRYVAFDYLLSHSDIISLHVPLTKQTHHLINRGNIGKIKKGAVLVNTARGAVVETDALLKALGNGTLSAAGLDVLEEEALVKEESQLLSSKLPKKQSMRVLLENHALMGKENVLITPHNAFNSKEAVERIMHTTVGNILAHMKKAHAKKQRE